ncbi:hypothetical protein ANRL2_00969 [Anaerolineae bacterium]|nr:hypothetical protein ANRL2_00969 [Anaerolineae bacterium]
MAILDMIERHALQVHAESCLNAKHKNRNCDLCLACPTDAIHLNHRQVQMDWTRYNVCGLCAAVCVGQVFRLENWDERMILDRLAPHPEIEFVCRRGKNSRQNQYAPWTSRDEHSVLGMSIDEPSILHTGTSCAFLKV